MGPGEIRRAASQLQHLADEVRRLADQVVGVRVVQWRSIAATGFRDRLNDEANRARTAAVRLDEAAGALSRHAVAVENVAHVVDEVGGRFGIGAER